MLDIFGFLWFLLSALLEFGASVLLIILAIFIGLYLNAEAYLRIRRLGYLAPTATLLLLGVDAVAILAVTGSVHLVLRPSDYWDINVVIFCVVSSLMFVAFGTAVLVRMLPKRRDSTRAFGPRRARFPFISLGCLIIAGSIVGGAALIYFDPWQSDILVFFMVPIVCAYLLIVYGRSIRNPPTIEDELKSDARLPVLYLRPFMSEGVAFVMRETGYGRSRRIEQVRFDDYLKPAIEGLIGPFVALGNPEDYLPHMKGAVHTYADDEGWYEKFEQLAGRSACMVMRVSDSNNLKRELTFIRREGLQRRLFVFTNTMKRKSESHVLRVLGWICSWLYGGPLPASTGLATWECFAENLGKLGFQLGNDPGRGAVVTFDAEGNAVIMVKGAEGFSKREWDSSWPPTGFVVPIRQHLVKILGLDLSGGAVKAESPQPAALPSETVVPTPG